MSTATTASRTQVWLESLGEWSWPGQGGAAAEMLPPSWVPAFPPRGEPALAAPAATGPRAGRARRLLIAGLLSCLTAVSLALVLEGRLNLERELGISSNASAVSPSPVVLPGAPPAPALPTLSTYSAADQAGSSIVVSHFSSVALNGEASFYAYLPAAYASTNRRYPVLYLLHGNSQPATAFLQIGLQEELDRLIAHHVIPPMIAVMIQGGPGSNNWRNVGARRYESYVLEVQETIDRALPTIASRGARAIAGDSMGGYGAMNVALDNPYRFGVVESWLGFFNGLDHALRADRPVISRLGLRAFLYGGASDRIADPSENAPFAAALRAAGAGATSAVYPGDHSMETLSSHLGSMLAFAGHAVAASSSRAAH